MAYILKDQSEVEYVEWGSLRWISNPININAKQLTAIEVIINKGQGHKFHFHPNQEEIIYVLSGKIEQWVEKECKILSAGDSCFIQRGTVHASFSIGDEPATLFVVLGPCANNEMGYEMQEVHEQEPWKNLRI